MRTLFFCCAVAISLTGIASVALADQINNPNGSIKGMLNQQRPHQPPPAAPKKPPQEQPKRN